MTAAASTLVDTTAASGNTLILDRCYVHGSWTQAVASSGIRIFGPAFAFVESWLSDVYQNNSGPSGGFVPGISLQSNGSPVLIRNSHIEAATQWLAMGAATANLTVIGNHFTQNLASRGVYDSYTGIGGGGVKMLFDRNVFEYAWQSGSGAGRIMILSGALQEVTFSNNVFRSACQVMRLIPNCPPLAGSEMRNLLFSGNFFYSIEPEYCAPLGPVSTPNYQYGVFLDLLTGAATCTMPQNLIVRHNHIFFSGSLLSGELSLPQPVIASIFFLSNLITVPPVSTDNSAVGLVHHVGGSETNLAFLLAMGSSSLVQNNVLLGGPSNPVMQSAMSSYDGSNFFSVSANVSLLGGSSIDPFSWTNPCGSSFANCALVSATTYLDANSVPVGADMAVLASVVTAAAGSILPATTPPTQTSSSSSPLPSSLSPTSPIPTTTIPATPVATSSTPPASSTRPTTPPLTTTAVTVLPSQNNSATLVLPAGPILINGTFQQSNTGVLVVSLSPNALGGQQSAIVVTGCANVSGSLVLSLADPINATTQLPLLQSPCLSGSFQNISLSGAGAACSRSGGQLADTGSLTVLLQASSSPACSNSGNGGPNIVAIAAGATAAVIVLLVLSAVVAVLVYKHLHPHARFFGFGRDNADDVIIAGRSEERDYVVLVPTST
jgi:hypothetical protein